MGGFLGNKHVIAALIIAPVLAIIAYFAVDYMVKEPPQKMQPGGSYALRAQSDCRYESGLCNMVNKDVKFTLKPDTPDTSSSWLELSSNQPLERAFLSFYLEGEQSEWFLMEPTADEKLWRLPFLYTAGEFEIRLIAQVAETHFFAEVGSIFLIKDVLY